MIKTGFRLGDAAEMCMIELVDFNEIYVSDAPVKKTRRKRGSKSTAATEELSDVENAQVDESTEKDEDA